MIPAEISREKQTASSLVLFLHNSEFTNACSFLQGSKSIPETLRGMYVQYEVYLFCHTYLILCLFLSRILAVFEIVLKLLSVFRNSFICYRGRYFAHHVKSLR